MEREKPSSNSHEKVHALKKNAEGTSRRTKETKRKPSKIMMSSEESSSDELVNTYESRNETAQLYSHATADRSNQKESVDKLKIYRTSETLKKEYTTKQNVEETFSSKGKAFKRITSREKRFSGEMLNSRSSRERPYPIHSRASSDDNSYLKISKKIESKSPSSSKSLRKIDFAKKNVEEIFQPTQSNIKTYQNIDYCEDDSTEESRTDNILPMGSSFSLTDCVNKREEWFNYQPLPTVIKRTENGYYKRIDSGEKITFGFYPSFGNKGDTTDRLDTGEFSQESSKSEVLPGYGNLSKYGISTPFSHWANISYVMRLSEADEEPVKDDTRVPDVARARMNPMETNKEFQKFRDLKIKEGRKEKQTISRTDHFEPQKGAFASMTPMVNSTVETKNKNDGTETAGIAFAENLPKTVHSDIVKRDGEKTKDLTTRSKIDDAKDAGKMPTYGGLNGNIIDLKSSSIAAKDKRSLKRLSDLSYFLKENRLRHHIFILSKQNFRKKT